MKFGFPLLLILFTSGLKARDHYEYWSKLQVEKALDRHWILGSDLQFRTQSNYRTGAFNPFQNQLAYSFRVWTNYKSRHFSLLFSPFAFFRNFEIDRDSLSAYSDECRVALGILKNLTNKHSEINLRLLLEHRAFLQTKTQKDRLRYLFRWRPLVFGHGKSALQPFVQEEYFMRMNSDKYLCDQNRIQLGIKYKKSKIDFTLSYQYSRQRADVWINRHQLYSGLLLTLQ